MIPTERIEFIIKSIKSQKTHPDYARVTDLTKEYHAHISGVNLDEYLKKFVLREDEKMFEQRKRLTNAISPALANSLKKPFYKVSRNSSVKRIINLKDPNREDIIRKMVKYFYGSREDDNKGLDYWLKMRFIEIAFEDPNAFVVIEWEGKEAHEVLEPRPFEVSSSEAINFEIKNDELKWLFCKFDFSYTAIQGGEEKDLTGNKYTLYDQNYSFNIEQFDPIYFQQKNLTLKPNQTKIEIDKKYFIVSWFEPKLGYVPAFRVGCFRDGVTKGRTYVNPFHSAMTFFRKSLKVVSELDLTMTLHAFPQKWQYAEKCKGESKTRRCDGGKIVGTADTCSSCKGSGVKTHTTAQDIIYLPIPESKEDMFDLDKMSAYKYPPIDLIKFQNEFIQQLKEEAHFAVYNSNMFIVNENQFAKTATEVNDNMEGIYDALEPYTEKYSEVWKFIIKLMVRISGGKITDDMEINHTFPADLKLKSTAVILAELKKANESGAPSFMRDELITELAGQVYSGDDMAMLKYYVRHRFFPFNGLNTDEIMYLMGSNEVSQFTKVLYANYQAIFTDIEKSKPNFYQMPYLAQWDIVTEATQVYIDEVNSSRTAQISFQFPNETENIDETENGEETSGNEADENKSDEN